MKMNRGECSLVAANFSAGWTLTKQLLASDHMFLGELLEILINIVIMTPRITWLVMIFLNWSDNAATVVTYR